MRSFSTLLFACFICASFTPIIYALRCRDSEFQCDGWRCIPNRWMCDGDPDCIDEADEKSINCGAKTLTRDCKATEFRCANGRCIPVSWRCDNHDDCRDNSDEDATFCRVSCRENEFTCNSGQCVTKQWRCDKQEDCADGSDEIGCDNVTATVPAHMFQCSSGSAIPIRWRCDGEVDCVEDQSDEMNCDQTSAGETHTTLRVSNSCRDREFACGSYCVPSVWLCDGDTDCPSGEDERNCPARACPSTHFTCADSQCVAGYLRCNGVSDCADHSDEVNCTLSMNENRTDCNSTSHFLCATNNCIPRHKLCNNNNDCGDWQDESETMCGANECQRNNGGCSQRCINTLTGYHCGCNKGFRLFGNYTCEDVDECREIAGVCSQRCMNTVGNYHCSCYAGYERDVNDFTRCRAATGDTYLLFSHRYDIRSLRLRDLDMTSIVSGARGAAALDFHFGDRQILWSDSKENSIYRANLTNTNAREILAIGERVSADGLAVDWIHKHIYFTDTVNYAVKMMTWDARWIMTLVKEEVGQPRAIVVTPLNGYVLWSDWGSDPKIERSNLDGSDREAIVTSPHVHWPNGLTIDHPTNRLYWCDGRLNSISSSNLDGSQVEVILFDPVLLRLPYSISVFEDRIYWTDWTQLALHSANKFTGTDVHNVSAGHLLEAPKVVHVFHQYRQPSVDNVCSTHACTHMCMRTPQGKQMCACPDNFNLASDKNTCVAFGATEPHIPIEHVTVTEKTVVETAEQLIENVVDGGYSAPAIGLGIGLALLVLLTVAVLGAWWMILHREVPHTRFRDSVYKGTTSIPSDREFMIEPTESGFNTNFVDHNFGDRCDVAQLSEADDAPLTPPERKAHHYSNLY